MANIPDLVRKYVEEEMRGVYTISLGIVEEIDEEEWKARVSMVSDEDVILSQVPIASAHAEDGFGEVNPVVEGTEGLVLHPKRPLTELIEEAGHVEQDPPPTEFRIRDGLFFPQYWNDDEETAVAAHDEYEEGDYLYAHPSGTQIWIRGEESSEEEGAVHVVAEGEVTIEADTVKVGNPAHFALNDEAQMNDTFLGLGGGVDDPGTTDG